MNEKQEKLRKHTKMVIGIVGLLFLCYMSTLCLFSMPKYISGEVPWPWLTGLVAFVVCLVAILIGLNVIKTEGIEALFRVENETWKDNVKQGIRAFALGLPSLVLGGILVIARFHSEPGELDLGPFNFAALVFTFLFPMLGLGLTYLSAKIWIITIRRYRAGDESFNDQQWSGSEFLNSMIGS